MERKELVPSENGQYNSYVDYMMDTISKPYPINDFHYESGIFIVNLS